MECKTATQYIEKYKLKRTIDDTGDIVYRRELHKKNRNVEIMLTTNGKTCSLVKLSFNELTGDFGTPQYVTDITNDLEEENQNV